MAQRTRKLRVSYNCRGGKSHRRENDGDERYILTHNGCFYARDIELCGNAYGAILSPRHGLRKKRRDLVRG